MNFTKIDGHLKNQKEQLRIKYKESQINDFKGIKPNEIKNTIWTKVTEIKETVFKKKVHQAKPEFTSNTNSYSTELVNTNSLFTNKNSNQRTYFSIRGYFRDLKNRVLMKFVGIMMALVFAYSFGKHMAITMCKNRDLERYILKLERESQYIHRQSLNDNLSNNKN